jgi:hypothetical protein
LPPIVFSRGDEPRAREVRIVGLDRRRDAYERQRPVGLVLDGLRLDAAEHGRAAALVLVRVRLLSDEVFVAALAVRHEPDQVALRAGRHVDRGLLAEHLREGGLEAVDGGVLAVDVVPHVGRGHGGTHPGGGLGDGIAAQIDELHGTVSGNRNVQPRW